MLRIFTICNNPIEGRHFHLLCSGDTLKDVLPRLLRTLAARESSGVPTGTLYSDNGVGTGNHVFEHHRLELLPQT